MSYARGSDGIFRPPIAVVHREDQYPSEDHALLAHMQESHFWYRGRHRFLLEAVRRYALPGRPAIDLGAGCGGWAAYLRTHAPDWFQPLAVADSSLGALQRSLELVPGLEAYQVDLLNLGWEERWDTAFLLDVLEHIPDDIGALRQIGQCLRPGGRVFITAPALQFFWSWNDDAVGHVRRYSRQQLEEAGRQAGLRPLLSRYFMFFLSPLLYLSRLRAPGASPEQLQSRIRETHKLPPAPLNALLSAVFCAESWLGLSLPFPWGTSVLGIFEKA